MEVNVNVLATVEIEKHTKHMVDEGSKYRKQTPIRSPKNVPKRKGNCNANIISMNKMVFDKC